MKNLKRITAIAAAVLLTAASWTNVLAFYEGEDHTTVEKDEIDTSEDITVTASSYFGHNPTEYSVEIAWGSMEFQYVSDYAWNPDKLQYQTETYFSGKHWIHHGDHTNMIRITNRSNAQIFADSSFQGYTTEDDPLIIENIVGDIYNINDPAYWTPSYASHGIIFPSAADGIDPGNTAEQGRVRIGDLWLGITGGALDGKAKDVPVGTVTVIIKPN